MSPETWTQAELVRAIGRIEATLKSLGEELRSQRSEYVHREEWAEFKVQVAKDQLANEAEQKAARLDRSERERRIREDFRNQVRWAIGAAMTALAIAITAAGIWLV